MPLAQKTNKLSNSFDLLSIYKTAIRNFPLLRYSWVLIATICILTLIAYNRLDNADVFLYAIAVIFISFFGFILSALKDQSDTFKKFLLNFLITCLVITMSISILGFGSFIIWERPKFYLRWFPNLDPAPLDSLQAKPSSGMDSKDSVVSNVLPSAKEEIEHPKSNKSDIKDKISTNPMLHIKTPETTTLPAREPELDKIAKISGVVNDNGKPREGVQICHQGKVFGTTDKYGSFSVTIPNVPKDNLFIEARWNGRYSRQEVGINQSDVTIDL